MTYGDFHTQNPSLEIMHIVLPINSFSVVYHILCVPSFTYEGPLQSFQVQKALDILAQETKSKMKATACLRSERVLLIQYMAPDLGSNKYT